MIVISEFMDEAAVARLAGAHAVTYDPALVDTPERLFSAVATADALIVRNRTQVTADLLSAGPELRCVGRLGVGLDNIDQRACAARGVAVYPATGANDQSVAEYVVACILMLLRGAYHSTDQMHAGTWPRQALMGREASGRTLGLIGFGSIARETAVRARALGMFICAHDPFLDPDDPVWSDATRCTLEELLARADAVSLHVPLTEGTRRILDADALAAMKTDAVLINAARGGVVDEVALAESLRRGHLAGAALDVFEEEPLGAAHGQVFAGIPNLILTPHIAGVTEESNIRVSALIAERVSHHLEGL